MSLSSTHCCLCVLDAFKYTTHRSSFTLPRQVTNIHNKPPHVNLKNPPVLSSPSIKSILTRQPRISRSFSTPLKWVRQVCVCVSVSLPVCLLWFYLRLVSITTKQETAKLCCRFVLCCFVSLTRSFVLVEALGTIFRTQVCKSASVPISFGVWILFAMVHS